MPTGVAVEFGMACVEYIPENTGYTQHQIFENQNPKDDNSSDSASDVGWRMVDGQRSCRMP